MLDNTIVMRYYKYMIASFECRDAEALFNGQRVGKFTGIESVAMRKLDMLDIAARIEDLKVPPGNRLEALKGKRQGQWSIRINDQWRLCFRFEGGNAHEVEIVDYH